MSRGRGRGNVGSREVPYAQAGRRSFFAHLRDSILAGMSPVIAYTSVITALTREERENTPARLLDQGASMRYGVAMDDAAALRHTCGVILAHFCDVMVVDSLYMTAEDVGYISGHMPHGVARGAILLITDGTSARSAAEERQGEAGTPNMDAICNILAFCMFSSYTPNIGDFYNYVTGATEAYVAPKDLLLGMAPIYHGTLALPYVEYSSWTVAARYHYIALETYMKIRIKTDTGFDAEVDDLLDNIKSLWDETEVPLEMQDTPAEVEPYSWHDVAYLVDTAMQYRVKFRDIAFPYMNHLRRMVSTNSILYLSRELSRVSLQRMTQDPPCISLVDLGVQSGSVRRLNRGLCYFWSPVATARKLRSSGTVVHQLLKAYADDTPSIVDLMKAFGFVHLQGSNAMFIDFLHLLVASSISWGTSFPLSGSSGLSECVITGRSWMCKNITYTGHSPDEASRRMVDLARKCLCINVPIGAPLYGPLYPDIRNYTPSCMYNFSLCVKTVMKEMGAPYPPHIGPYMIASLQHNAALEGIRKVYYAVAGGRYSEVAATYGIDTHSRRRDDSSEEYFYYAWMILGMGSYIFTDGRSKVNLADVHASDLPYMTDREIRNLLRKMRVDLTPDKNRVALGRMSEIPINMLDESEAPVEREDLIEIAKHSFANPAL